MHMLRKVSFAKHICTALRDTYALVIRTQGTSMYSHRIIGLVSLSFWLAPVRTHIGRAMAEMAAGCAIGGLAAINTQIRVRSPAAP